jgi:hypothetical protein
MNKQEQQGQDMLNESGVSTLNRKPVASTVIDESVIHKANPHNILGNLRRPHGPCGCTAGVIACCLRGPLGHLSSGSVLCAQTPLTST